MSNTRKHIFATLTMLAFSALCVVSASAQMAIKKAVAPVVPPDSADVAYYGKKHFWRAAAETFGFNIGLWAFDRYVQKGDFAYISLNSIKENFKHGFIWDNDMLGTNTFLHPYNGSLYFNAGRANGFNFWQSELFAIGGSAMWELFMECEYPSTNDIITRVRDNESPNGCSEKRHRLSGDPVGSPDFLPSCLPPEDELPA